MAKLSGISRPTIARIEKDEYKRLPVDIIEKLLPYLEITMEYITEQPKGELDHLPPHLREFVVSPENVDYIEYGYLQKRRKEIESKLPGIDQSGER